MKRTVAFAFLAFLAATAGSAAAEDAPAAGSSAAAAPEAGPAAQTDATAPGASVPAGAAAAPQPIGEAKPEEKQPAVATPVSPFIQERAMLSTDPYAAARIDNAPIDPALKGFFAIPGTKSMIRFGGFAKLDVIHDFEPAGDPDQFITSSIPVQPKPDDQNTSLSVRQSRTSLEARRPTSLGDLRIYYENDFFGPNNRAYNLRHAYGQVWNVLAGFSFSTLVDADSLPETLDNEGPGSMVYVYQPEIRYTWPVSKRHSLAFSVEKGTSDIVTDVPNQPEDVITPTSPWPDGVVRWRFDADTYHLQAGMVFRSVGGYVENEDTGRINKGQVFAYGGSVSGAVQVFGKDSFVFQANGGQGMGRYVQDLAGLGPDVGLDKNGKLVALPLYSALVGYQHYWIETLRSTVTYGYAFVDSVGKKYTTSFHKSDYAAANLIWNPKDTSFNAGIEYLFGDQTLATGDYGSANRIQFSFQYDFIR